MRIFVWFAVPCSSVTVYHDVRDWVMLRRVNLNNEVCEYRENWLKSDPPGKNGEGNQRMGFKWVWIDWEKKLRWTKKKKNGKTWQKKGKPINVFNKPWGFFSSFQHFHFLKIITMLKILMLIKFDHIQLSIMQLPM